jgi:hypothetical protein
MPKGKNVLNSKTSNEFLDKQSCPSLENQQSNKSVNENKNKGFCTEDEY